MSKEAVVVGVILAGSGSAVVPADVLAAILVAEGKVDGLAAEIAAYAVDG